MADIWTSQRVKDMLGAAFHSLDELAERRYCVCVEPDLPADAGLMCRRCFRRNQAQELALITRLIEPHDFEPDSRFDGILCRVCAHGAVAARHHDVAAVGLTSWGEKVSP